MLYVCYKTLVTCYGGSIIYSVTKHVIAKSDTSAFKE